MQKFIELPVIWDNEYNADQKQTYSAIYGDEKTDWPDSGEEGTVSVRVDHITSFNPIDEKNANIRTIDGKGFKTPMPYEELKTLINGFL